jgi:hypothetical protein
MAKAAELDIDLAASEQPLPPAATSPRTPKAHKKPKGTKRDTPVNFRWPAAEVKRMKRAALEADMKIQDYMLACFHAFLKN